MTLTPKMLLILLQFKRKTKRDCWLDEQNIDAPVFQQPKACTDRNLLNQMRKAVFDVINLHVQCYGESVPR